jgi:hypothetical protein
MVNIYILQLKEGKYYVGKTDNPIFYLDFHSKASGEPEWTQLYKPISIIEFIPNCDYYDEDKYTKIYMNKYGIENVRGGTFLQTVLDGNTIKLLEKMIRPSKNNCINCGINGYFSKECNNCQSIESIDNCLTYIEKFIENKKKLELVDEQFEKPKTGKFAWSSFQDNLLRQEKERAVKQKEKNTEYLPLIEVMYKALNLLNKK